MNETTPRPRGRTLILLGIALFLCGTAAGWLEADQIRFVSNETDGDFFLGSLCAVDGYCSLVSPYVRPGIVRGNYYNLLMAAVQLLTWDPTVFFRLGILLHGLATLLVFLLGTSVFGAGYGVLGGGLFAVSLPLLELHRVSTPASFATLFVMAAYLGCWRWFRAAGPRNLIVAAASGALAFQFHLLAAVPLFALLPMVVTRIRQQGPGKELAVSAGAICLVCGPQILFALGLIEPIETAGGTFMPRKGEAPGADIELMPTLGNWAGVVFGGLWSQIRRAGDQLDLFSLYKNWPSDIPIAWVLAGAAAVIIPGKWHRPSTPGAQVLGGAALCALTAAMATFYLLGYDWLARYAYIFVPPVILLTLFAAHATARLLFKLRYVGGLMVLVLFVLCGHAYGEHRLERSPHLRAATPATALPFDTQMRAVESLIKRGFRTNDLHRRVHGKVWHPFHGMVVYPSIWLDDPSAARDGTHAIFVENCQEIPASFARWQEVYPGETGPIVLAGYEPSLRNIKMSVFVSQLCEPVESGDPVGVVQEDAPTCTPESVTCWSGDDLFSTVSRAYQWAGVHRFIARRDPGGQDALNRRTLDYSRSSKWNDCWRGPRAEAHLDAQLHPTAEARVLVVAHDPYIVLNVHVDGRPVDGLTDPRGRGHHDRLITRFDLPETGSNTQPRSVHIRFHKGKGKNQNLSRWGQPSPIFLEVFEEPKVRCLQPSHESPTQLRIFNR